MPRVERGSWAHAGNLAHQPLVLAAGVTPHFTGKVGSFSLAVQTSHLLSELVKKAWSVAEFKPCTCEQRGCHTWSHRDAPSLHRLSSP